MAKLQTLTAIDPQTEPTPRPCLPGEALPPEPPAWGGPAPELPTLRPLRTPAELRADADSLQAEAAQALQALATIPALQRSAPDIRSMAQQLGDQAARLRGVAAAREAQAQARPLAPVTDSQGRIIGMVTPGQPWLAELLRQHAEGRHPQIRGPIGHWAITDRH